MTDITWGEDGPPTLADGSSCEADQQCESGLCRNRVCRRQCFSSCACPAGFQCSEVNLCFPGVNECMEEDGSGPPDGSGSEEPLPFDPSNLRGRAHTLASSAVVTAAPGDRCFIHTDRARFSCGLGAEFAVLDQGGSRELSESLAVFWVRSLHVEEGATLTVEGTRPLVLIAQRSIVIDGTVNVDNGYDAPEANDFTLGAGPGGGGGTMNQWGGGGEGGSYCSRGGLGSRQEVRYGHPYGGSALTPLRMGSSGGSPESGRGFAGDGGGAIHLVAGNEITIGPAGQLLANGGAPQSTYELGGGSGGALLLEAPSVNLNGVVSANGGNGSGTADGSVARGAHDDQQAERGQATASEFDFQGGGGGFGWIRINTERGMPDVAIDATISPFESTECTSFGTLVPSTAAPAPPTCSAVADDTDECEACVAANCCTERAVCDADSLCLTCRTATSPGPACATDDRLSQYYECLAGWCPRRCADIVPESDQ